MKNKAILTNTLDISYAAEFCNGKFIDSGIVIKPSDKSNIKIWVPIEEISKIVLPNSRIVEGEEVLDIFNILEEMNRKYGLE